eukprot:1195682-Prorocentrum_minimum.AAC.1
MDSVRFKTPSEEGGETILDTLLGNRGLLSRQDGQCGTPKGPQHRLQTANQGVQYIRSTLKGEARLRVFQADYDGVNIRPGGGGVGSG